MSQRAFLQDLDSRIMTRMQAAGMADVASYRAGGTGAPLTCSAYVDDAAAFFGDDAQPVAGARVVISLMLFEVPTPARNDTVTIDGTIYTLDALVTQDQSISRWVVS